MFGADMGTNAKQYFFAVEFLLSHKHKTCIVCANVASIVKNEINIQGGKPGSAFPPMSHGERMHLLRTYIGSCHYITLVRRSKGVV